MAKTKAPSPAQAAEDATRELPFEEAARRLQQIVEQLEGGQLPLEQSLTLFEEGVLLARSAQQTLSDAERRVEELLGIDEHGDPIVKDLDVSTS